MIRVEQAKVYRCPDGRRFFTAKAALKRWARLLMKKHYPCVCDNETGYFCGQHPGESWFDDRVSRFIRFYEKKWK